MGKKQIIKSASAGPTRRRFVFRGLAVATAASGPLILTPGKAKAADRVVVSCWGGRYEETMKEAFFDPFTKQTGIPVVIGPVLDFAKIQAMSRTGNMEYDVIDMLATWVVQGEQEGLWAPIDTRIVDRTDVLPIGNRPTVQGIYVSVGGITYNEQRHGRPEQHPKSWAEYWDVAKFPGRRGLEAQADRTMAAALMADGVHPQKIYPMDVERAFKSLEKIKPHIKLWLASGGQGISTLETGESDFNFSYGSRCFASRAAGNPLAFVPNQNFITLGNYGVTKSSNNKEAAMKLVNFMLNPERQGHWSGIYGIMGTNAKSAPYVKAEAKPYLIEFDNPNLCWADMDWWGPRNAELSKRLREWLIT